MFKTVEERVADLYDRAGSELEPLGVAPIPQFPQLFIQPESSGFDWIVLRLEDDPLFQRGELDIPPEQRQRLRALDDRGVQFDDLLIAHEVPKGAVTDKSLETPDRIDEALKPTQVEESREARVLRGFFRGLLVGGVVFVSVPLAPLALLAAANPDPALIGVLTAKGDTKPGTPAAFFLIARW